MDVRYGGVCSGCGTTITITLRGVTVDPEGAPYCPVTCCGCGGGPVTPVRITPYGWTAPPLDEDDED